MSKNSEAMLTPDHTPVYVILRLDSEMSELSNAIAVVKAFQTKGDAEAEMHRLNAVNASRGCRYEVRVTKLVTT